jgi:hypothetical protein
MKTSTTLHKWGHSSLESSTTSSEVAININPNSIYAGAIGAALWGGFRHEKLARDERRALAS